MRGFDALQIPNTDQYEELYDDGFEVCAGYTRVLTHEVIDAALGVGMAVLPLIEAGNPTDLSYFTPGQGKADGEGFVTWANANRMPYRVPYVGTFLDFDCPVSAMEPVILPYVNEQFTAVGRRNRQWMYGPIDCIEWAILHWNGIAGTFQAKAASWSQGRNGTPSPLADIVQIVNGVTVAGVQLDTQVVLTAARLWRVA